MLNNNLTNRSGYFFAGLTAFMWANLAIFLKIAFKFADTWTIVWFRFFIAFCFLFIFIRITDKKELSFIKRPPWQMVLAAIALSYNYFGYANGVNYTSPSMAQIIIQFGPFLLALSGIFLFKEKLTTHQLIGSLIFIIGFTIFYYDQFSLKPSDAIFLKGCLWVFSASLAWALFAIIQKAIVNNYSPQTINLVIYFISSIIFLPFVNFKTMLNFSFSEWIILIFLGMNTFVAYGALSEAIKRVPANHVSIIITLNPLITILFMYLIKRFDFKWIPYETISNIGIMGAGLLITGAMIVIGIKKKRAKENR